MIYPYKNRFLISVYVYNPPKWLHQEKRKNKDKTGVGRRLKHKHARRILGSVSFAELNINPTWLAYAGSTL